MKSWQETGSIFVRLLPLVKERQPAALATVCRIMGSTYRRAGAKLLILEKGPMLGNVSGGCLEEDVRQVGLDSLKTARSNLRHYDTGEDEETVWGLGLGCNGQVDVLVQPVSPAMSGETVAAICEYLDGDEPFALSMALVSGAPNISLLATSADRPWWGSLGSKALDAVAGPAIQRRLQARTTGVDSVDGVDIFTEVLVPPPDLIVCGAGDDAIPLVCYAADVGFRVTVVDHRSAYLAADRFPAARRLIHGRAEDAPLEVVRPTRTYAVVKTHAVRHDAAWASRLVEMSLPYVGLLGPRDRTETIMTGLEARHRGTLFGPVGLDLGAEGPEQVAVSIVAEVLAVHSGRNAGFLRDRAGPIHDK